MGASKRLKASKRRNGKGTRGSILEGGNPRDGRVSEARRRGVGGVRAHDSDRSLLSATVVKTHE